MHMCAATNNKSLLVCIYMLLTKKQDGILTGKDIIEKTNMYMCLEGYLTCPVWYPVSLGNLTSINKKPSQQTQETLRLGIGLWTIGMGEG